MKFKKTLKHKRFPVDFCKIFLNIKSATIEIINKKYLRSCKGYAISAAKSYKVLKQSQDKPLKSSFVFNIVCVYFAF